MFTNTKIRTKCEFQGVGCTGISTLEVPDEDYPPEVIMVCTSCCLDIAEGLAPKVIVSQECPECERELDADATSCHNCDPKF